MSVLIVKEKGFGNWEIIRQSPKITTSTGRDSITLGCWGSVEIISADFPDFEMGNIESALFIRGRDIYNNGRMLRVTTEWRERFIKAVVKLNRKYSNNTKIDEEDVIIRET
jgi:hypothetical protein